MSNYGGESWNLRSGRQSGYWNKTGKLISKLEDIDLEILIVNTDENK